MTAQDAGRVTVRLPRTLMAAAGEKTMLEFELAPGATVAVLLNEMARSHPILDRRLRDETGRVRQYVNVYVDGEDIRQLGGAATPLRSGQVVRVIQSIAGG